MQDVFIDALMDTLKMVPFLLFIYIAIEWLEFKYSKKIRNKVRNSGKRGVLAGSLFGCIPQCGFSVISSALYTKRLITLGTLMAVYLSTSDEAIPIIIANPDKIGLILPIILTKLIIALIAGYSIDFVIRAKDKNKDVDSHSHGGDDYHLDEKGCCGHDCSAEKPNYKELFIHPVIHTLKIFLFIYLVSALIGVIIFKVGEDNLGMYLLGRSYWQPVITALFGLIPNCATSVAITQIFLSGGISFGSAIAGLCSGAGLGIIVLLKENDNRKESLKIIGLLLLISIISGIIIQTTIG